MKALLALLVGIVIGAAALWYFNTNPTGRSQVPTAQRANVSTTPARDSVQEKLRVLDLRPDEIKNELARTGVVIRRKAIEAGQAMADAAADARVTAIVKGKLLADKSLSALSISVNTTAGVVTLSGTVPTTDDIGKAMVLAMDTQGVREVVSTLQVKTHAGKS